MEIVDRKIGRFGWEIFLVRNSEGWVIGLVDSKGELYQIYSEYDSEKFARYNWEKS